MPALRNLLMNATTSALLLKSMLGCMVFPFVVMFNTTGLTELRIAEKPRPLAQPCNFCQMRWREISPQSLAGNTLEEFLLLSLGHALN